VKDFESKGKVQQIPTVFKRNNFEIMHSFFIAPNFFVDAISISKIGHKTFLQSFET
jgi:hypothetical protein